MNTLKYRSRKLFEISLCTICLDPMLRDLVVFIQCGHVFPYNCGMNCHVNSRKCPNCRIRSTDLQVVEEITEVNESMQQLCSDLSADQKEVMPNILSDHEQLLNTNQLLAKRIQLLEEKQKSITTEVEQLQKEKISLQEYIKSLEEKIDDLVNKLKSTQDKRIYYEMKVKLQENNLNNKIQQKAPIEQSQEIYDLQVIKVLQLQNLKSEFKQLHWQTKHEKLKIQIEELKKENYNIRELRKYNQDSQQRKNKYDIETITNIGRK